MAVALNAHARDSCRNQVKSNLSAFRIALLRRKKQTVISLAIGYLQRAEIKKTAREGR
jgi:hypothetical protein